MTKIQRPGPGAGRIERQCEVCGDIFHPRKVDVDKGKGKHCSNNCSAKAYRRKKVSECAGCGTRVESPFIRKYCETCLAAYKEQKRTRTCKKCQEPFFGKKGRKRCDKCLNEMRVTWENQPLGEVPDKDIAYRLGVAVGTVSHQRRKRGIRSCVRRHPKTVVECEWCGKSMYVYKSRNNGNNSRWFCSRACHANANVKGRIKRECERCGATFHVPPYRSQQRFCGRACVDIASGRSRFDNVQVFGEYFSLEQLASAAKVSRQTMRRRIKNSRSAEEAVLMNGRRQPEHRRLDALISFRGRSATVSEWANETGVHPTTLYARLFKLRWGVEKALYTPVARRRHNNKSNSGNADHKDRM